MAIPKGTHKTTRAGALLLLHFYLFIDTLSFSRKLPVPVEDTDNKARLLSVIALTATQTPVSENTLIC